MVCESTGRCPLVFAWDKAKFHQQDPLCFALLGADDKDQFVLHPVLTLGVFVYARS